MNVWKITTIVLILTNIITILLFVWLMSWGLEITENETECSINICKNYETFYYDEISKICYCYNDKVLKYQEFIKK